MTAPVISVDVGLDDLRKAIYAACSVLLSSPERDAANTFIADYDDTVTELSVYRDREAGEVRVKITQEKRERNASSPSIGGTLHGHKETIKDLCISGLLTDGAHHKTWYFERLLLALSFNLEEIRAELAEEQYSWEEGIAP